LKRAVLLYLLVVNIIFYPFHVLGDTISFEKDSFVSLIHLADYSGAKEYILGFEENITNSDPSDQILWYINLASIESTLEEYDNSFEHFLKAIKVSEEIGSLKLKGEAEANLLELYRKLRMYEEAFPIIRESISKIDMLNVRIQCYYLTRAAAIYNESHYKHFDDKFLDTAELYSKQALKIAIQADLTDYQASCYNELGNIYEKTNRLDLARKTYDQSIGLWVPTDTLNYANSIKNKGSYFLRVRAPDSAIVYFNRVLRLLTLHKSSRMKSDTYWGLKTAYFYLGDSVNYYKNSFWEAHHNTLYTENLLQNKIHELNTEYESEKKDILLSNNKLDMRAERLRNQVNLIFSFLLLVIVVTLSITYSNIRKKNLKLKKLVTENDFLIGESNHRIKNNLQLIISLIGREIYKSKEQNSDLVEISEKINSIASLHQHLYLNDSKESINVKSYVQSIIENFNQLNYYDSIDLEINLDDFEMKIDKEVYLGLLITELFTNSIKHAFPEGIKKSKLITLDIKHKSNSIELLYRDNGIGLEPGSEPSLIQLIVMQLQANIKDSEQSGFVLNLEIEL
jgi:two-component sensor histidine kinase